MIYLRGNTASQEVPLGPFLDSTDGNTQETALTIANTDIKIWKTGATTLANKNSGGATHISNGIYYAVLDATDTNTYGSLKIFVHVSGALACVLECIVLPEPIYDSFVPSASGAILPIFGVLDWGTAQSATTTSLVLRSGAAYADDELNGATAFISSASTGAGQRRVVNDYVGSTDTATIDTLSTSLTGTIGYLIFGSPPASVGLPVPANMTQIGGDSQSATDLKDFADAGYDPATNKVQGLVLADAVTTVNGLAANVITAAATAADFTTEIQSGLATAAALATVDDFLDTEVAAILAAVDTEVAAIKAKTDQLVFTKTNELDVNVQSINGATVTGDGNATPWDGA